MRNITDLCLPVGLSILFFSSKEGESLLKDSNMNNNEERVMTPCKKVLKYQVTLVCDVKRSSVSLSGGAVLKRKSNKTVKYQCHL